MSTPEARPSREAPLSAEIPPPLRLAVAAALAWLERVDREAAGPEGPGAPPRGRA